MSEKLRLGGMALRNGLLVHGPTHWAAAVRGPDGKISVASGRKPRLGGPVDSVPGLRGVAKLAEAFVVIPLAKRGLPDAQLPMQDVRTVGAMTAAAVVGKALRSGGRATLVRESATAAVSLLPAVLALRGRDRIQEATPAMPEQTVETVKEDVQWAKTQLPSGRK